MKRFFLILGGIFIIVLGAVIALPFLIPASTYKEVIESQLEANLNRDVTLTSDPSIQFFPNLGATISGVEIANAEGFTDPYFAKADTLSVAVKWAPLLSRRIEIASANFVGTDIRLEEKKNGTNNWTFSSDTPPAEAEDENGTDVPEFDALIPKAQLSDSRVVFVSHKSDLNYDVSEINLIASMKGMDAPITLNGDFKINSDQVNLSAEIDSLRALMEQTQSSADLKVDTDFANVRYDGYLTLSDAPVFDGSFSAKTDQPAKLASFVNFDSEIDFNNFGKLSAEGRVQGTPDNLRLSELNAEQSSALAKTSYQGELRIADTIAPTGTLNFSTKDLKKLASAFGTELEIGQDDALKNFDLAADLSTDRNIINAALKKFQLDDVTATGNIGANLFGASKPYLIANLDIPKLVLTPYIDSPALTNADPNSAALPVWSTDPLDLSFLNSANADIELKIDQLANERAEILDLEFDGSLKNGRLAGVLKSVAPESGRGEVHALLNPLHSGNLETNFSIQYRPNGQNYLTFKADGSGIAAADLVKFLTGQSVLHGVGELDVDAKTFGRSISELVDNLSGPYQANVSNGAIYGINLAQLIRTAQDALSSGQLPAALSPGDQTDFSSMALTGNLNSGTAEIGLFKLESPILLAEATGAVDIFNQEIDIRLIPRAIDPTGQLSGIEGYGIPLRVYGSWDGIKGSLDTDYLGNLAAQAARNEIQKEVEKRVGGEFGSILGGLLGGGSDNKQENDETSDSGSSSNDEAQTENEEQEEDPTAAIIKGLFGTRN